MNLRKLGSFLLWTTLIVGVIVGALRLLLVRTWTVPSDDPSLSASIAPSLAPGDTVLLLHAGNPGFGELVRCTDPDEPRRWVIGRIGGEAGDTVEIKDERLVVNGRKADLETACKEHKIQVPHPNTEAPVDMHCDIEAVGSSAHKRAYGASKTHGMRAPVKRTVQAGFFFLVSDNRVFPFDSTVYGPVPVETCDARVIFRLWSEKGWNDTESRMEWIN